MKKFAIGVVGFALLVALAAPRDNMSAAQESAASAEPVDAWELAAREAREQKAGGAAPSYASASSSDSGTMVLHRRANGHFFATADVEGRPIEFLVDTGATLVALSEADARRAGVRFDRSTFQVIGSGASGPVRGQFVRIKRLKLGGKTLTNVEGAVLDGADMSLLGQSVLARLGKIEMAGDTMTIG